MARGYESSYGAPERTTYLRELRPDGARISRVHGENGANEINKSQREKENEGLYERAGGGQESRLDERRESARDGDARSDKDARRKMKWNFCRLG